MCSSDLKLLLINGNSGSKLSAAATANAGQFAYDEVRSRRRLIVEPSRSIVHKVRPRGLSTAAIPIALGSPAGAPAAGPTAPASVLAVRSGVAGHARRRLATPPPAP